MRIALVAADLVMASPAMAQTVTTPPVAPKTVIVLNEEDVAQLRRYIGSLPYDQAAPIVNFLAARQADTQAAQKAKK